MLAVLGALALVWPASAQPSVTDVRLGAHADKTRFVVELTEAPRYRVFSLPDPYRVVIDLPQLDWPEAHSEMTQSKGLVSALRFGLFTPGTSRVVLDLTQPSAIEAVFVLPPREGFGHRLVLDLAPVSRQAFLGEENRKTLESEQPLPSFDTAMPTPAPRDPVDFRPTVVIDAGHGGVDPGAIGVSGLYEKDLTLRYARSLKQALEATGRYRVAMTRDSDVFLELRERLTLGEHAAGDLFLSLHANTNPSGKIRGASVYTLSETSSDAEAAALAAKENKADIIGGVDLTNQTEVVSQILIDLAQRETMNLSKTFANTLVGELGQRTELLRNTHRFAGFAVLKSPTVPSVLVEIGYMSNREEERLLLSDGHRAKIVAAIIDAVDQYFKRQQAFQQQ
ncbi:MAG: N-acetylmuramoyl-L-alanine amidase [Rhodovibrionaceae bacterium]